MIHNRSLLASLFLVSLAAPSVGATEYTVVVHPSVKGTQIRKADLAAIFLGRVRQWGGRLETQPIDQSAKSFVRREFSSEILGMPVAGALQYWSRAIQQGRRPPAVRGSDAEVLEFVSSTEGAVGYVLRDTTLPPGVRALAVMD